MATAIELPQLGNTVEECVITRWVKRAGDAVSAGEVVVEIETDKTTFEITAPVEGTVLETFVAEGAIVPVFTRLCVIGRDGENVDALRPVITPRAGVAAPGEARAADDGGPEGPPLHDAAAEARSRSGGAFLAPSERSESRGAPPPPALPASAASYSPRARRFADTHNFHPTAIAGSGPGGRVLEADLRREHARAAITGEDTAARTPTLRRTIARRMRESLASTAQYTLHMSAAAAGLLRLRARLKASADTADITISDLLMLCTIRALVDAPDVNAEYIDGAIVRHREVHLAFACDTPKGLLAPVIRDAHTLSAAGVAARAKTLAARALDGTIAPDDLAGATFTISNLGALGIESFTPVLNPPQVAILGVGAIQLKAVRRGSNVVYVDMIGLSLTCDHQVIDGAPGARFLGVVRAKIENVESLYA